MCVNKSKRVHQLLVFAWLAVVLVVASSAGLHAGGARLNCTSSDEDPCCRLMALQLVLDVALDRVEACLDPSLQARLVLARSVDQHENASDCDRDEERLEALTPVQRKDAHHKQARVEVSSQNNEGSNDAQVVAQP